MKSITCSKPGHANLFKNFKFSFFSTKFNDCSILIMIISSDYLNLSLANEYVGDVTIPTQVINYNQHCIQADEPIRLQYSHQIKLLNFNLLLI